MVQTVDEKGSRSIQVFKGESQRDTTIPFKELVSKYFKDYGNHFDIVDMYPEVSV